MAGKFQGLRPTPAEAGYVAQAVKTSVAATLSLYLAGRFGMSEPYWAAISAIIVTQSDMGALETASINRLVGTAIGAVVGACAFSLGGNSLGSFAAAVLCAILACAVVGRWETYRFAGVTVSIVMLVTRLGSPWTVALHRFLEVSFGIVVAFVVSMAAQRLPKRGSPRPSRARLPSGKRGRRKA